VADAGTPDWWLDRLYKRLRARQPIIKDYDAWYSGEHPAPRGHEKATLLLQRLLETVGLNILPRLADAATERMQVEGFKVNGKHNDDIWAIWQGNNFDAGSRMVLQEEKALSESYVLVDPNLNAADVPTMTPEHPEQAIVEHVPGIGVAPYRMGLKVLVDDTGDTPLRYAFLLGPDRIEVYAAPTRVSTGWALRPGWEYQESLSGDNPLDECPLVPFTNRPRMLKDSRPEWYPALPIQKRINKTLLDRMAMQDEGAFKAMWATGLDIPVDPETGQPVEPFRRALDRAFINENPEGKFGQLEAEDIRQMLLAVKDDVMAGAIVVPTPPDQFLGEIVNVSEGGLEAARDSLTRRVNLHKDHDGESFETVARLTLKAAGKDVPNAQAMETNWVNDENVTEAAKADAAVKWTATGVPREALWERFLGASPDEIEAWREMRQQEALDPVTRAIVDGVNRDADTAGRGA
jgi:hypothetical protein